jgi:hypothetical protein
MKEVNILEAITRMAADDNKGLLITTTVLDAGTVNDISHVTFRVTKAVTGSAGFQSAGIAGDYMCCAFFIDRDELKKYKKKLGLK